MYLRRAELALYLIPVSASAAITAVSSLVDMPFSELALSRLLSSYQGAGGSGSYRRQLLSSGQKKAAPVLLEAAALTLFPFCVIIAFG